ncbi:RDD family protein [Streptosporangium sp. DT93]|uniref:RDD family protein n=1 Tax=Streptosporangium sp. DT93 TaxID=3393428 RepID=UPI003CED07AA
MTTTAPFFTPRPDSKNRNLYAASMGRRLGARVVDSFLLGVILAPVLYLYEGVAASGIGPYAPDNVVLPGLIVLAVTAIYEAVATGVAGGTVGKFVAGIRVVDLETGDPVSMGVSFTRYAVVAAVGATGWFVPYVGAVLAIVWVFSMFLDGGGYRRAWHDRAARTWVVERP